jgi:hypothetical protein
MIFRLPLFLDTHGSISSISASIGKSILFYDITKGIEKNKITPDVMLLKIDHWANNTTTVVIEESAIKRH